MSVAAKRAALFFVLWLALSGSVKPGDLAAGIFAAALATYVSKRLLPADADALHLRALLLTVPHFLWQSLLGGIDVARRALGARVDLTPGYVRYDSDLPPGVARNTFTSITSLMPGTLPCGADDEGLLFHALDVTQPVASELAAEEEHFGPALLPPGGADA